MKKLGISKKIIIVIAVIVAFSVISISAQENFYQSKSYSYDGIARAAIIDQLYDDIPNTPFQNKATEYLEGAGYKVDIYTTKELTVDFFKKLPSMNYNLIVYRSHAIGNDGPEYFKEEKVSLFTGEKYRDDKYISEQLLGQVGKGAPYMTSTIEVSVDLSQLNNSSDTVEQSVTTRSFEIVDSSNAYFLIGAKYVDEIMEGEFPDTVFVLAGCSTLSNPSLAKSLINRGASSVVGWDALVGSNDNDSVTLSFLENVLINNMEIKDAVDEAMKKATNGTVYDANLSYYDGSI